MSGFMTIIAGLLRTLFIRLPLGIWLAVLFSAGWMLLERQYDPSFPVFPCTTSWPPEFVNPSYPLDPSGMTLLNPVVEQITSLEIGIGEAELSFGHVEYGALLGVLFGLVLCWPCGIWMTMRRYSGVLLFPLRVVLLGLAYAALGGSAGYGLAHLLGANLISTGYMAVFGLAMPILVPLPFWLLRPLFPSAVRRQANALMKHAKREAKTTLADIAKLDPGLGNVTKGTQQKEWDYYATVSGLFLGLLLGEKRGAPAYQRNAVEKLLRRKLNKQFEKGDPGLTAVSQFCKEYLEKGAKFTTEILVGLWLAMQMKGGDLNAARDKDLAASLGSHIVQGMNRQWPVRRRAGSIFAAILLWAGVGGLAFFAMNPNQVEGQIAWLDGQLNQPSDPTATTTPHALGDIENADTSTDTTTKDTTPASATNDTDTTDATDEGNPPTEEPLNKESISAEAPIEPLADNSKSPEPEPMVSPDETTPRVVDPVPDSIPDPEPAEKPADDPPTEKPEATTSDSEPENAVRKEVDEPVVGNKTSTPEPQPSKLVAASREWSHSSGRKLQATAVSYRDGAVELKREDGRSAFINLKDLSAEDRQVVYSHFAGENATETSPAELNAGELRVRQWSSKDGSKQVTAAILKISKDSIELLRADGQIFSLPVQQLSTADQAYVRSLTKADQAYVRSLTKEEK